MQYFRGFVLVTLSLLSHSFSLKSHAILSDEEVGRQQLSPAPPPLTRNKSAASLPGSEAPPENMDPPTPAAQPQQVFSYEGRADTPPLPPQMELQSLALAFSFLPHKAVSVVQLTDAPDDLWKYGIVERPLPSDPKFAGLTARQHCTELCGRADAQLFDEHHDLDRLVVLAQNAETFDDEYHYRCLHAILQRAQFLATQQEIGFYPEGLGGNEFVPLIDLTQDVYAAFGALRDWSATNKPQSEYFVNYSALLFDPFLHDYNGSLRNEPDVNIQQWNSKLRSLKRVFKGTKNASADRRRINNFVRKMQPLSAKERHAGYVEEPRKQQLRKRILRLWSALRKAPKDVKYGFAVVLLQSVEERCDDGLSQALIPWETTHVFGAKQHSLGTQMSQVIRADMERFIDQHGHPGYRAKGLSIYEEEATEVVVLLRERMRWIMGIPGDSESVKYPFLGGPFEEALQPAAVLLRYVAGGTLIYVEDEPITGLQQDAAPPHESQESGLAMAAADTTAVAETDAIESLPVRTARKEYKVTFDPTDTERLITLMKNAYVCGRLSELNAFCETHPLMGPYYQLVFQDLQPVDNPYFSLSANPLEAFSDKVFQIALNYFGYLAHNPLAATPDK